MTVGPLDTLCVWVCIKKGSAPKAEGSAPKEIMVQFNDGTGNDGGWGHRAYWGDNVISFGTDGTASRRRMGDLPGETTWRLLEIPASQVGLERSSVVTGVSFDHAGGTVHWGDAYIRRAVVPPVHLDGVDVLWTLFASPEFQYVK